jgi:hypothetical protein
MKNKISLLFFMLLLSSCNLPISPLRPAEEPATTTLPLASTPDAALPVDLVCNNETCLADGLQFDYLIVTRPKFIEALSRFVAWKTGNGFHVGLVTVEWLEATYSGRHLAEKMKTGMHDLRKRAGVIYVLLVGDTEMTIDDFSIRNVLASYDLSKDFNVPTGFYRRVDSDPPEDVLPSDAYFVEDRDWDPNNTGLNPRPDNMVTGDGTLQADLYLGRWPVREPEEIAFIFEKTRQAGLATQIFFSADLSLSDGVNTSCNGLPPSEYDKMTCYLDTMITARNWYFEANAPDLSTDSMFVNLYDPGQAAAFFEKFMANQGVAVAEFHGSYTCWQIKHDCTLAEEIRFEHIFPLLEIEACSVSAFYVGSERTITESFSLAPTGPAVVTEAPNPVLFLRELRDGKPVGEAFWSTASTYLYWPNPILLMGDPSLVIFAGQ